eukprot:NODE_495_length_6825_cov_1.481267.p2 type:complete len:305 gc:universal NODE_495_length_6825_cov_1.481267:5889-6803(+)
MSLPWLKVTYSDSNNSSRSFCIQCISCIKFDCSKCGQIHLTSGNGGFSCLNCKKTFEISGSKATGQVLMDFNNFIYYYGNLLTDSNVRIGFLHSKSFSSAIEAQNMDVSEKSSTLVMVYDTFIDFFATTIGDNKYERIRPRISLKKCKLLQMNERSKGFVLEIQEEESILLWSEVQDFQHLWIKSISSKMNKMEKRSKIKNPPSPQSRAMRPVLDKRIADPEKDPFYPLLEKLMDSFPELNKGKTLNNTGNTLTNDLMQGKSSEFDYTQKSHSDVREKQTEIKPPTPATNANILAKLDEYFQFK